MAVPEVPAVPEPEADAVSNPIVSFSLGVFASSVTFTILGYARTPLSGYAEQLELSARGQLLRSLQMDCSKGPADAGMTAAGGLQAWLNVASRPFFVYSTSGSSIPIDCTARAICSMK